MYAIIRTGGKQAKVTAGDVLDVERLKMDADEVTFTPLLVVGDDGSTITGRQDLEKIRVHAKILGETRGDKIDIFRYKPKTGYRRRAGHRQLYTRIQITDIELPGRRKKTAPAETPAAEEAPAPGEADEAAEATEAPMETKPKSTSQKKSTGAKSTSRQPTQKKQAGTKSTQRKAASKKAEEES